MGERGGAFFRQKKKKEKKGQSDTGGGRTPLEDGSNFFLAMPKEAKKKGEGLNDKKDRGGKNRKCSKNGERGGTFITHGLGEEGNLRTGRKRAFW